MKIEEIKSVFLVGDEDGAKDKWEEVIICHLEDMRLSCTCALFETTGILCRHILCIMHHKQLKSIPSIYIMPRWNIEARHTNVGIVNNQNDKKQHEIIRSWALRAKFNRALDLVSDSESYLSMLENMLQDFIVGAEKELGPKDIHVEGIQVGSNVDLDCHASIVLRDGEEINVRAPDGPTKAKGRPKNASRMKSGIEASQGKKIIKQRKCGNCQQSGHYKTACPYRSNNSM